MAHSDPTPAAPQPIIVVPYDPHWPEAFTALSTVLAKVVGALALRIEHVGSTSVPGLAAKPILDLDLVIADMTVFPAVSAALSSAGYAHEGDQGVPGREAFKRARATVPETGTGRVWLAHHLYVCPQSSPELARHLALRDALRADDTLRDAYAALKYELAQRYRDDRAAYTDAKTGFIEALYRRVGL